MVFRVLAVLNEFESDVAGERTKAALDYRRSKGLKTGGRVPYGYTVDENMRLHKDSREQKIVRHIKQMHNSGKRYSEIPRHLNEKGIATKCGGQWFIQSVKNIVCRPDSFYSQV